MERSEISRIAHRRHPIAAPVALEQAQALLSWLSPAPAGRAVDLGCGSGVWLVELAARHPGLTGVGVDLDRPGPDRRQVREAASPDRLRWVHADASTWSDGLFDVALCVGASHAFGGLAGTLAALRRHLRPGGQALLGDAFWQRPPGAVAQQALQAGPDDLPTLTGLVDAVQEAGFEPGYGHVSTLAEWDAYEWSWTGSLVDAALSGDGSDDDRRQALDAAREHRAAWLSGYREQLGFATLVLHDLREP